MVEIYTLIKKSKSYKTLANDVIAYGIKSKDTKFLKHESLEIDVSQLDDRIVCLPRYRANGKESSIKYAIAETIWYASKQLKTDLILKFGPIWKKMEDSRGLVNSNYGHQIFNNQNFEEKAAELVKEKKVRFFIASDDNQFSRTDLVCNNAVDVYLDEENRLSVRVVARSIDLIFGYPYDMFAAQLFVRYLQRHLLKEFDLSTKFETLRFDIENVHIYDKDVESVSDIRDFNDDEFIVIDSEEIFGMIEEINFDNLNVKNVEAIREILAEKSEVIEAKELNEKSNEVRTGIYRDAHHPSLRRRLLGRAVKDSKSVDQFERVIDHLNKNKFDRKNLIKHGDSLLYISRIKCGFGVAQYEVTKYEL